MGSSTSLNHDNRARSSICVGGVPGRGLWVFDTSVEAKPLESCLPGNVSCGGTSADAWEAASRPSLVSSILESMASGALGALVDGTWEPGRASGAYCSGEERNDRGVEYLPLDLGCSRRKVTVPLPGDVGMRNPCRLYNSAIRQSHSWMSCPATAPRVRDLKGITYC